MSLALKNMKPLHRLPLQATNVKVMCIASIGESMESELESVVCPESSCKIVRNLMVRGGKICEGGEICDGYKW